MGAGICQACRREAATQEIENDEENCPYRLCAACAKRLDTLSLRPLEWVQLVAIHGSGKHELHSDFYTETGLACQPGRKVRDADKFPYPKLDDVRENLPGLLDLAMSLWFLEMRLDVIEALKRFSAEEVLTELTRRNQEYRTSWVHEVSLDICARVLGDQAADWVRADDRSNLVKWIKAVAHCLPLEEGFVKATAAFPEEINAVYAPLLTEFHSPKVLDWLEEHKQLCKSPGAAYPWGRTAAYSGLTGERAKLWVKDGPPMSWVAVIAILMIAQAPGHGHWRAYLHTPRLLEPGSWRDFREVLEAYEATENDLKALKYATLARESAEVKGLFET